TCHDYEADLEPHVKDDVLHEANDVVECVAGTKRGKRGKNKIVPPHEIEEDRPLIHRVGDKDNPKNTKVGTTITSIFMKHLPSLFF
ncbi:hypothetical protein O6P43_006187, partial [Quillaja saponaria]